MITEFTEENRKQLVEYLNTHDLPMGLGTKESACSIAAINLAISGKLTDDIPGCMSLALGKATIRLQDAMPNEMRNSKRYKDLLPHMAGTGRKHEKERAEIIINWIWGVVLPQLQSVANEHGFGDAWRKMCEKQTPAARAAAAVDAARAAAAYAARAADDAAYAAYAAYAADDAARAADAAYAADDAARAAAYAADAAAASADADAFWKAVDPIGVLEQMTFLRENT